MIGLPFLGMIILAFNVQTAEAERAPNTKKEKACLEEEKQFV
jgi:hypothetical protein